MVVQSRSAFVHEMFGSAPVPRIRKKTRVQLSHTEKKRICEVQIDNPQCFSFKSTADIANEDEHRRERDRGRIAEYVDEIIDLLKAMGMNDEDCNVEEFISPLEEDHVNVIMMLHWVTNAKATLILSLVIGRWNKC